MKLLTSMEMQYFMNFQELSYRLMALLHKSVIFDSLARIVSRLWVLGDSGAN